jgi:hypothetical protein
LPVNPVSPEEAVAELLGAARAARGDRAGSDDFGGTAIGRSWDDFPRHIGGASNVTAQRTKDRRP